ncbi:MAG: tetratricopeptide repeat protein [Planctomycetota bacterium]|jgi:tetratricopeptide (TPR) repeat protein
MTEEYNTQSSLIRAALEDFRGDIAGFVDHILAAFQIGLPEKLLVAARSEFERETDPEIKIRLRFLIAQLHFRKRDLKLIPAEIEGIAEDEAVSTYLRIYALYLKGRTLIEEAEFETAAELAGNALALYEKESDRTKPLLFNILGTCHLNLAEHEKAMDYYEKAIEEAEKINPEEVSGGFYNNLAIAHGELGNDLEALDAYEKALEIEKKNRNRNNVALAMSNISAWYLSQERPEDALEFALNAFDILYNVEDKALRTTILLCIAEAHMVMGNLEEALDVAEKGLFFSESVGDRILEIEAELLYGTLMARLGDPKAKKRLKEALELYEELDPVKPPEWLARAMLEYGRLLCKMLDPRGVGHLLEARKILRDRPKTPQIRTLLRHVKETIGSLPSRLRRRRPRRRGKSKTDDGEPEN